MGDFEVSIDVFQMKYKKKRNLEYPSGKIRFVTTPDQTVNQGRVVIATANLNERKLVGVDLRVFVHLLRVRMCMCVYVRVCCVFEPAVGPHSRQNYR